jgi:pyruvate/2-oxoglutarate dehydrogenase complex dihydrolipoamide acyltransferase (E2) component
MRFPSFSASKTATVCGLALAAGFLATSAKADDWDKKTVLTVNKPIQITDAYLQPGTYVLMLDRDSESNRHIVRVYNADQNHLITTIMAMPAYRVRVSGNTQFTFWETPAGSASALRDWFWPGDNFGQEFAYPAHLKQVAQVTKSPAAAPVAQAQAQEQPAPQSQAEVQQQPATQPQAAAQTQPAAQPQPEVREQEEVIIALAEPAPQSQSGQSQAGQNQSDQNQNQSDQGQSFNQNQSEQSQAPENQQAANQGYQPGTSHNQPDQLPKTATPYPLVGLVGMFSLGIYGLLRAKRSA